MKNWSWLLALLALSGVLQGCGRDADSFFSGRPSGMAMAHNRVLDGTLASMVELMQVPQRFPDASEAHIASWQESIIAWWNAANGRERILAALPRLTEVERRSFESWVSARSDLLSEKERATLDEIARALRESVQHGKVGGMTRFP